MLDSGSVPRASLPPPTRMSLRVARIARFAKIEIAIPVGAQCRDMHWLSVTALGSGGSISPPSKGRVCSDPHEEGELWGCRATVTSSRRDDMIWQMLQVDEPERRSR